MRLQIQRTFFLCHHVKGLDRRGQSDALQVSDSLADCQRTRTDGDPRRSVMLLQQSDLTLSIPPAVPRVADG